MGRGRRLALALLLVLLFLAGSIELIAPRHVRVGEEVEAVALVNGVQAPGEITVVSPAGDSTCYANGHAKFNASGAGTWLVRYSDVERRVEVENRLPAYAEPLAYGAFAFAALAIAYSFFRGRRKLLVEKRFEAGTVSIEVRNAGEDLLGVRISDPVPEDAELDLPMGARHGARESAGPDGRRCVRWHLPVLRAGERVVLAYGMRTSARVLPGAEVRASLGREVIAGSDEVRT
ncbi:Uncharacterised protein [Candidatus Burarchaeum australiense]|nr:Uncharacterised protein [Candidatus Burarchaeum australiense]